MTTVKLEGFKELEQALRELPKATGKSILRRIAKGALEPLAKDAAAKAPDRTGKLSFSIVVSEKRTRRAGGSAKAKFVAPGVFRSAASNGIVMAMGPAGGLGVLPYAAFVEFGTVDTPAQPYMRPAWDAGANGALDYVKDNLGAEIEKAAVRAARKATRQAGG